MATAINFAPPPAGSSARVAHDPAKILARQLAAKLAQNEADTFEAQHHVSARLKKLVEKKDLAELDAAIKCRDKFGKIKKVLPHHK